MESELYSILEGALRNQGFPVVGGVDYDLALETYRDHAQRYENWIQRGMAAEMGYLVRGVDFRKDPKKLFPELSSILTVLSPYPVQPVCGQEVAGQQVKYSRYLNGPDYHEVMKSKLTEAMKEAQQSITDFKFKVCVDTSAVLEKTWASLTGLGWIGKNTLLIHPQWGSYTFIGVVFTNQALHRAPRLHKDFCGQCTRCLKACPTGAILETHEVDASKCISYLTLEKRGPFEKSVNLAQYVAGCDICQEVCPFNTKISTKNTATGVADYLITNLEVLFHETLEEYKKRIKGTALSRIKYPDFQRNLEQFRESSLVSNHKNKLD